MVKIIYNVSKIHLFVHFNSSVLHDDLCVKWSVWIIHTLYRLCFTYTKITELYCKTTYMLVIDRSHSKPVRSWWYLMIGTLACRMRRTWEQPGRSNWTTSPSVSMWRCTCVRPFVSSVFAWNTSRQSSVSSSCNDRTSDNHTVICTSINKFICSQFQSPENA